MRKVSVNGSKLRQILKKSNGYQIDNMVITPDISGTGDKYTIIVKNKCYKIEVEKREGRSIYLILNNKKVVVEDIPEVIQTLEQLGVSTETVHKVTDIKAPMPGKILEIKVKEGETVEEGDPLLVLEAMKMENVLKATGSGTIIKINVKEGQNVEKNDVLMVF